MADSDLKKDIIPEPGEVSDSGIPGKPPKKHLIHPTWLRRTLKTLLGVIIFVLLIPVLLYIPFVQDFAVGIATDVVRKSTGMNIEIGKFRLSFPVDVTLDDVTIVEASGDTMVRARQVIADVRPMPLLKLDVRLKRLRLLDGYYRMLSPDSSMLLKVNAGFLEVDDKSSANIATSEILLNKATLRDGSLSLYMDVWKKKETPQDSASTSAPFKIIANVLSLQNFNFGMSMLPTIDTMAVALRNVEIKNAKIDLGTNVVQWKLAAITGGDVTYLTPTAEYIKNHPAPPPLPSTGPPMQIKGDSIAVDSLSALYAVRDARPLPGFDPSYMKVDGVRIGMRDFYNESSTVRLPLTRLAARERSGLQITSGSGTVGIDSVGLALDRLDIRTLFSSIRATADVPFAMMALEPSAQMRVDAKGRIGLPDVEAFMPDAKSFTSMIPGRKPLDFDLDADGSLADLKIRNLLAEIPGVVNLNAKGSVGNPLDIKKMTANLSFDGALIDPAVADKFVAMPDMKLPAFTIKGEAMARGLEYGADFKLLSDAGDLAAKGRVALTPENYTAEITATDIDVARFVPDLGVGRVTARVKAHGRGFNPLSGHAVTDAIIDLNNIVYNRQNLRDIHIDALLDPDGTLNLSMQSANPGLDLTLEGSGMIHPDNYTFDIDTRINDLDLRRYGFTDSICYGSGDLTLRGNAQPGKWIYDVEMDARSLEWWINDMNIHLPDGVDVALKADKISTDLYVNSLLTTVDFKAETGLDPLITAFSEVGKIVNSQMDTRQIDVAQLNDKLPPFTLALNANGNGLLGQIMEPAGLWVDTVYVNLTRDSLIHGNVGAYNFATGTTMIDTITLGLSQRGKLLDYRAHIGNRPGTLDEFAKVNLNGYIGENRVSAFLNQWNVRGEQGYRIGLTAAMMDSVVTAHITPLHSTIAYLPWTFNNDNYLDFNIYTKHIEANLEAKSAQSSILARTQMQPGGNEELYVKIDQLHIQDFLRMWAFAPQMTGDLNADLHVIYDNQRFMGAGTLGLHDFVYEKTRIGNFDLDLDAAYGLNSSTDVYALMKFNGLQALSAYANLKNESQGMQPDSIGITLTRFPLRLANPFMGDNLALEGFLNGDLHMQGSFASPILNGAIDFDSVAVRIPMLDARLRFGQEQLDVVDNVVTFNSFDIFAANDNPLTINGTVNAKKFSSIALDLKATANNFQLIKSDSRSKGDLYGKIFLNLDASVKGPMQLMNINGNVNLLGTTDATYRLNMEPAQLKAENEDGIVKFVNFNDTVQIAREDTIVQPSVNMRVDARLTISNGTKLQVLLSNNGTDKVVVTPTANLSYYQNYMGDMSLNGTLTLGEGLVRYDIPVMGEKTFEFNPSSAVHWNGNVMDPVLNISATDEVKANVTSGNSSHLVNFLVTLNATGSLNNPHVGFDLSTNDDLTVQNELSSMSADQRQTQAMNLLLYGQYSGANTRAKAASGNFLYSFLESKLNSWAAKNIRGVDLSFGVNQYERTSDGVSNTETSYSYQVSKSLFNNRFKINVGGNYSTDSADDEIAQNLISDVSFEYILRQTQNMNMSARLFRHTGYESILEGEVTEMGVGFVLKRRLSTFRGLLHWGKKRRKSDSVPDSSTRSETTDSAAVRPADPEDSIPQHSSK